VSAEENRITLNRKLYFIFKVVGEKSHSHLAALNPAWNPLDKEARKCYTKKTVLQSVLCN